MTSLSLNAQDLPTGFIIDAASFAANNRLTMKKGKTTLGLINPANGEILVWRRTPSGSDVRQAIGKPQAPGSTFKTKAGIGDVSRVAYHPRDCREV